VIDPPISVIIPTYNRAALLLEAMESVLHQTFKNYELIVIDDGSTDDTRQALEAHTGPLIYCYQNNQGVSAARNRGLQMSRGQFIAFLDSDDLWLPEKLAVQFEFFSGNRKALICQTEEIWLRNGRRVNPRKKHRKPSGDVFAPSLNLCLVSPSAVMIRRELFSAVGEFDETFPACEDYDLWLRIAARYPVYLIDRPLVVKRGGHRDQLSRTIPALDRYRIRALLKLLDSGCLNAVQHLLALKALREKCRIYGQGCIKHGKTEEGEYYLKLPGKISGPSPFKMKG
jgi:glycosyltransferase involved in cell wall biosynthesis